jgi:hypothetical protein
VDNVGRRTWNEDTIAVFLEQMQLGGSFNFIDNVVLALHLMNE